MGAVYSYVACWLMMRWTTRATDDTSLEGPGVEKRGFNLKSAPYFPAVHELPCSLSISSQYFKLDEGRNLYVAKHHWVVLAGIVADLTLRLSPQEKRKARNYGLSTADLEQPCYLACDRTMTVFPVVLQLNEDELRVFKQRLKNSFKEGNTIAVFYASWTPFPSGIAGVVVRRLNSIKIISCPPGALLHADNEPIITGNACAECGFNISVDVSCSACRGLGRYCSKRCRATYAPLHKKMCTAAKQVKTWRSLDWEKFEEPWSAEF